MATTVANPVDEAERRRQAAERAAQVMRARIEKRLPAGDGAVAELDPGVRQILFQMLIKLAEWRTLTQEWDAPKRDLANEVYDDVWQVVRGDLGHDGRLGVFPNAGVYLKEGEAPRTMWNAATITFDASAARALGARLDAIGESALERWPDPPGATGGQGRLRRMWQRLGRGGESPATERAPHMARAYDTITSVIGAVVNESERRREDPSLTMEHDPAPRYAAALANVARNTERAEALLEQAARRTAQRRYGRGMFLGTVVLLVLSIGVGVAFAAFDLPAAYGIAVPAGGLGAVMSVLQRMTSNRFEMSIESAANLTVFGMLRPFVGVIFAYVVVGLLEADLLSIGAMTGEKVALYGVVAFFAGFNERFAQDSLTSGVVPTAQLQHAEAVPTAGR
ncbi:MAG TPA: hypothetical protein VF549_18355 [Solirubrobacteraceae bacterium]|jgi:hypothetical protein